MVQLRRYQVSDAAARREIFRRAVRVTAARYYTPEQVEAWAPVEGVLERAGLDVNHGQAEPLLGGQVIEFVEIEVAGAADEGVCPADR